MKGRDIALTGLALYAVAGIATVLRVKYQQAHPLIAPAPGGVLVPPKHPIISDAYLAAIWPLVLLDPFHK